MQHATVGQNLSLLFYVAGTPCALKATVTSSEPFEMATTDSAAAELENGVRGMLLLQRGSEFAKAEALLESVPTDSGWKLMASDFGWERVDRRRYPRYEVQLPATIRAVIEGDEGTEVRRIEAVTEDVSIGGAWIQTDQKMEGGLLVEFQISLKDTPVRALSIVRWSETPEKRGFGVEFLEFVGVSRAALQLFLSNCSKAA